MTKVITVRNVNEALPLGLQWLHEHGIVEQSRNGRVLVSPTPVITEYQRPAERVLFSPLRDANPFFHLMEGLWMLAGRNDVAFPSFYAANIASFSDDGKTVAGAYGDRWRRRFGYDQLRIIIDELKANPKSRRCVLAMWDAYGAPHSGAASDQIDIPAHDLALAVGGGKDVPCNTQAYFDTIGGRLNMLVTCRSNDVVWGCYGANVVHFSMLHEFVAATAGIELGVYRQLSNNYHAYIDRPDTQRLIDDDTVYVDKHNADFYQHRSHYSMVNVREEEWTADLSNFFAAWSSEHTKLTECVFEDEFFTHVAAPMAEAHQWYKAGRFDEAYDTMQLVSASDWQCAGIEWLNRREEKRNAIRN